jgi:cytochrome oxidase Cu insertion factor (SCO1/SenC/PrrC family)
VAQKGGELPGGAPKGPGDRLIRALRWVGVGLLGLALIGACGALVFGGWATRLEQDAGFVSPSTGDSALAGVPIGGSFSLTNAATGAAVTDKSFQGKWMLVYFGYTFCPDVCPTDLQRIVAALQQMGKASDRVVPIFITVDPARDTREALARYVALFSPKLVGLTGSQEAVDRVVSAYRVYVQKVPAATPGAPYAVNHSAFIYLMDDKGRLAGVFPPGLSPTVLAQAWRKALGTDGSSI